MARTTSIGEVGTSVHGLPMRIPDPTAQQPSRRVLQQPLHPAHGPGVPQEPARGSGHRHDGVGPFGECGIVAQRSGVAQRDGGAHREPHDHPGPSCRRANASAASRSSTSSRPTDDRPPDMPWPRKSNATTGPTWDSATATDRLAGERVPFVMPCPRTNTGASGESAGPWNSMPRRRTPSTVFVRTVCRASCRVATAAMRVRRSQRLLGRRRGRRLRRRCDSIDPGDGA